MITEGDSIIINCTHTNCPGSIVEAWHDPQRMVIFGTTVQLPNVQRNQSGLYRCILADFLGEVSTSITVTVTCKYRVYSVYTCIHSLSLPLDGTSMTSNSSTTQFALLGGSLTLDCTYDSVPPSTVTWLHNGTVLVNALGNVVITTNESTSMLTVDNLTYESGGEYICTADNTLASGETTRDTITFNITIQGECSGLYDWLVVHNLI